MTFIFIVLNGLSALLIYVNIIAYKPIRLHYFKNTFGQQFPYININKEKAYSK